MSLKIFYFPFQILFKVIITKIFKTKYYMYIIDKSFELDRFVSNVVSQLASFSVGIMWVFHTVFREFIYLEAILKIQTSAWRLEWDLKRRICTKSFEEWEEKLVCLKLTYRRRPNPLGLAIYAFNQSRSSIHGKNHF